MFHAHRMIEKFGVEGARWQAASKLERSCIDAAATVLDNLSCTDFVYGGLAVTCLPHRSLNRDCEESRSWSRYIGSTVYRIESGLYDNGAPLGIPFGSKARMILLFLQDQAVRQKSRVVDVVPSMHALVQSMGLRIGGMTYRQIADQARRIAGCGFDAQTWDGPAACQAGDATAVTNPPTKSAEPRTIGRLVDAVLRREEGHVIPVRYASGTTTIKDFPDRIVLSDPFYREAMTESVSLRRVALRQIGDNSRAIDLYIWLAYQLPKLSHPLIADWNMLSAHFGAGYRHPRQMKAVFIQTLQLVLAIYPEARVEACESGFRLHPSRPPVPS
jgi:hypothetical protein